MRPLLEPSTPVRLASNLRNSGRHLIIPHLLLHSSLSSFIRFLLLPVEFRSNRESREAPPSIFQDNIFDTLPQAQQQSRTITSTLPIFINCLPPPAGPQSPFHLGTFACHHFGFGSAVGSILAGCSQHSNCMAS